MKFQQNPSQGRKDKAANILRSASKAPLIALSIPAKISVCCACEKNASFRKIPNGSRDTVGKVLCTVPVITDRSQLLHSVCSECVDSD